MHGYVCMCVEGDAIESLLLFLSINVPLQSPLFLREPKVCSVLVTVNMLLPSDLSHQLFLVLIVWEVLLLEFLNSSLSLV